MPATEPRNCTDGTFQEAMGMLTDIALKALKPKDKIYKIADRDGMYVRVMPSGAISFRLDYRLNGRRETVYLGRYGRDGISLALAREKVPRRKARYCRWPIAGDREAARQASPERGEELWRIRGEVAHFRTDGRQHARHAARHLRAGASSILAQSPADGDYAG